MSSPVNRIKTLLQVLPKKDIPIGEKFFNSRDFESLKELVDSAIIRIERDAKKENPKEEYLNIDIDDLTTLQSEVDSYLDMLELPYLDTEY